MAKDKELTPEELEEQNGEELANREAMSVISYPGGPGAAATPCRSNLPKNPELRGLSGPG
jgi:hypothetical protein